jgi:hypothetical protein
MPRYPKVSLLFWCMLSHLFQAWCMPQPSHNLTESKNNIWCFLLTKHHATKAYWGNGGIVPRILDLGTRWRWVFSFTARPLYPKEKRSWYPLDRRLGGPQRRSERGGEENNSQPLQGLEPPIIQPVAPCYITELSQLLNTRKSQKVTLIFFLLTEYLQIGLRTLRHFST